MSTLKDRPIARNTWRNAAVAALLLLLVVSGAACLPAGGIETLAGRLTIRSPETTPPPEALRVRWSTPLYLKRVQNAYYVEGLVLVSAAYGRLYALDAETGEQLWDRRQVYPLDFPPCVIDEGLIYISDGILFGVEKKTGKLKIEKRLPFGAVTAPVSVNHLAVIGSSNGRLNGVSPATAFPIWLSRYDNPILATVEEPGKRVIVLDGAGNLNAHSPKDGSRLWSVHFQKPPVAGPGASKDLVFVGGGDFFLHAYAPASGLEMWKTPIGAYVWKAPVYAHGVVFTVVYGGDLVALDAKTGTILWQLPDADHFLTATDKRGYVIMKDGALQCVGLRDGSLQGKLSLEGFDWVATDPELGQFFAVAENGRVTAVADIDTLPKPAYVPGKSK